MLLKKGNYLFIISLFASLLLLIIIFSASLNRLGAFGCFDDCHNFLSGYFMLKGKTLYKDIFYNHQPLMPYLSFLVQRITHPATLYNLILYHRLTIIMFALFFDLLLIFRFRFKGMAFVLIYEAAKFYLFGDRFLPEALISYLLVYLTGIAWESLEKKKISSFDLFLSTLFAFLAVFLREPYVLAIIFLYLFILFKKRKERIAYANFFLFLTLSLIFILTQPLKNYYYDLVYINSISTGKVEAEQQILNLTGLLNIILYPLLILVKGQFTFLKIILFSLDCLFLLSISLLTYCSRQLKYLLFTFGVLALNALRYVTPGKMYYEAFHMLPWFAVFIILTILSIESLAQVMKRKYLSFVFETSLALIIIFSLVSPFSFLQEKINKESEFNTSYARYEVYGNVIKSLSKPGDKLFAELSGELLYFQSQLDSAYAYSLYTPWTAGSTEFNKARIAMFNNDPPDFYFCADDGKAKDGNLLPPKIKNIFLKLDYQNTDSCLYVNKKTAYKIRKEQWQKAEDLGFKLSSESLKELYRKF